MPKTKDAVVIGAGVIGASIAYQLALRGLKVIILEKNNQVAGESTGKSSAVIRQHYSNKETSTMAFEALQFFKNWQDFLKISKCRHSLKQVGVLWLMPQEDKTMEPCHQMLKEVGIKTDLLDSETLEKYFPDFLFCGNKLNISDPENHKCDEIKIASFEKEGGYLDPVGTTQDFAEAFKNLGSEISLDDEVLKINKSNNKIQSIESKKSGTIETKIIVNAAGPWAEKINNIAGFSLPNKLTVTRNQIVVKTHPEKLKSGLPVCGDLINEIYFRPEAESQILIGSIAPEDENDIIKNPDNYDDFADPKFRENKLHLLHHRIKTLKYKGEITSYAGLYTCYDLDWHPVIDKTNIDGFYNAVGFSGHGFKLAPIVGIMMAKIITGINVPDINTSVDTKFFRRDREEIKTFLGGGVVG